MDRSEIQSELLENGYGLLGACTFRELPSENSVLEHPNYAEVPLFQPTHTVFGPDSGTNCLRLPGWLPWVWHMGEDEGFWEVFIPDEETLLEFVAVQELFESLLVTQYVARILP